MGGPKGELDPLVGLGDLKPERFLSPHDFQTWQAGGTVPSCCV